MTSRAHHFAAILSNKKAESHYCYLTTVGIRNPDVSGFRMVRFSNGSKTKFLFLYKTVKSNFPNRKPDENVRFLNGLNHLNIGWLKRLVFKCFRYSNVSGIRMSGFRILTVYFGVCNSEAILKSGHDNEK